jgi:hypothetical protein
LMGQHFGFCGSLASGLDNLILGRGPASLGSFILCLTVRVLQWSGTIHDLTPHDGLGACNVCIKYAIALEICIQGDPQKLINPNLHPFRNYSACSQHLELKGTSRYHPVLFETFARGRLFYAVWSVRPALSLRQGFQQSSSNIPLSHPFLSIQLSRTPNTSYYHLDYEMERRSQLRRFGRTE